MDHSRAAMFEWLKAQAHALKHEVLVLFYAVQDPDISWVSRALAGCALAYALSPLDFIPVLGLSDYLLLLPGLVWLAVKVAFSLCTHFTPRTDLLLHPSH